MKNNNTFSGILFRPLRNNRGVIMLITIFILMLLIFAAFGISLVSQSTYMDSYQVTNTLEADYLARAVAQDVADQLAKGDDTPAGPFGQFDDLAECADTAASWFNANDGSYLDDAALKGWTVLGDAKPLYSSIIIEDNKVYSVGTVAIRPIASMVSSSYVCDNFEVTVTIYKVPDGVDITELEKESINGYEYYTEDALKLLEVASQRQLTLSRDANITYRQVRDQIENMLSNYPIIITTGKIDKTYDLYVAKNMAGYYSYYCPPTPNQVKDSNAPGLFAFSAKVEEVEMLEGETPTEYFDRCTAAYDKSRLWLDLDLYQNVLGVLKTSGNVGLDANGATFDTTMSNAGTLALRDMTVNGDIVSTKDVIILNDVIIGSQAAYNGGERFDIFAGGNIFIDGSNGGTVNIYGDVVARGSISIDANCHVFGTIYSNSGYVRLGANSIVEGDVYAQKGVDFQGNVTVKGSFVALYGDVNVSAGAQLLAGTDSGDSVKVGGNLNMYDGARITTTGRFGVGGSLTMRGSSIQFGATGADADVVIGRNLFLGEWAMAYDGYGDEIGYKESTDSTKWYGASSITQKDGQAINIYIGGRPALGEGYGNMYVGNIKDANGINNNGHHFNANLHIAGSEPIVFNCYFSAKDVYCSSVSLLASGGTAANAYYSFERLFMSQTPVDANGDPLEVFDLHGGYIEVIYCVDEDDNKAVDLNLKNGSVRKVYGGNIVLDDVDVVGIPNPTLKTLASAGGLISIAQAQAYFKDNAFREYGLVVAQRIGTSDVKYNNVIIKNGSVINGDILCNHLNRTEASYNVIRTDINGDDAALGISFETAAGGTFRLGSNVYAMGDVYIGSSFTKHASDAYAGPNIVSNGKVQVFCTAGCGNVRVTSNGSYSPAPNTTINGDFITTGDTVLECDVTGCVKVIDGSLTIKGARSIASDMQSSGIYNTVNGTYTGNDGLPGQFGIYADGDITITGPFAADDHIGDPDFIERTTLYATGVINICSNTSYTATQYLPNLYGSIRSDKGYNAGNVINVAKVHGSVKIAGDLTYGVQSKNVKLTNEVVGDVFVGGTMTDSWYLNVGGDYKAIGTGGTTRLRGSVKGDVSIAGNTFLGDPSFSDYATTFGDPNVAPDSSSPVDVHNNLYVAGTLYLYHNHRFYCNVYATGAVSTALSVNNGASYFYGNVSGTSITMDAHDDSGTNKYVRPVHFTDRTTGRNAVVEARTGEVILQGRYGDNPQHATCDMDIKAYSMVTLLKTDVTGNILAGQALLTNWWAGLSGIENRNSVIRGNIEILGTVGDVASTTYTAPGNIWLAYTDVYGSVKSVNVDKSTTLSQLPSALQGNVSGTVGAYSAYMNIVLDSSNIFATSATDTVVTNGTIALQRGVSSIKGTAGGTASNVFCSALLCFASHMMYGTISSHTIQINKVINTQVRAATIEVADFVGIDGTIFGANKNSNVYVKGMALTNNGTSFGNLYCDGDFSAESRGQYEPYLYAAVCGNAYITGTANIKGAILGNLYTGESCVLAAPVMGGYIQIGNGTSVKADLTIDEFVKEGLLVPSHYTTKYGIDSIGVYYNNTKYYNGTIYVTNGAFSTDVDILGSVVVCRDYTGAAYNHEINANIYGSIFINGNVSCTDKAKVLGIGDGSDPDNEAADSHRSTAAHEDYEDKGHNGALLLDATAYGNLYTAGYSALSAANANLTMTTAGIQAKIAGSLSDVVTGRLLKKPLLVNRMYVSGTLTLARTHLIQNYLTVGSLVINSLSLVDELYFGYPVRILSNSSTKYSNTILRFYNDVQFDLESSETVTFNGTGGDDTDEGNSFIWGNTYNGRWENNAYTAGGTVNLNGISVLEGGYFGNAPVNASNANYECIFSGTGVTLVDCEVEDFVSSSGPVSLTGCTVGGEVWAGDSVYVNNSTVNGDITGTTSVVVEGSGNVAANVYTTVQGIRCTNGGIAVSGQTLVRDSVYAKGNIILSGGLYARQVYSDAEVRAGADSNPAAYKFHNPRLAGTVRGTLVTMNSAYVTDVYATNIHSYNSTVIGQYVASSYVASDSDVYLDNNKLINVNTGDLDGNAYYNASDVIQTGAAKTYYSAYSRRCGIFADNFRVAKVKLTGSVQLFATGSSSTSYIYSTGYASTDAVYNVFPTGSVINVTGTLKLDSNNSSSMLANNGTMNLGSATSYRGTANTFKGDVYVGTLTIDNDTTSATSQRNVFEATAKVRATSAVTLRSCEVSCDIVSDGTITVHQKTKLNAESQLKSTGNLVLSGNDDTNTTTTSVNQFLGTLCSATAIAVPGRITWRGPITGPVIAPLMYFSYSGGYGATISTPAANFKVDEIWTDAASTIVFNSDVGVKRISNGSNADVGTFTFNKTLNVSESFNSSAANVVKGAFYAPDSATVICPKTAFSSTVRLGGGVIGSAAGNVSCNSININNAEGKDCGSILAANTITISGANADTTFDNLRVIGGAGTGRSSDRININAPCHVTGSVVAGSNTDNYFTWVNITAGVTIDGEVFAAGKVKIVSSEVVQIGVRIYQKNGIGSVGGDYGTTCVYIEGPLQLGYNAASKSTIGGIRADSNIELKNGGALSVLHGQIYTNAGGLTMSGNGKNSSGYAVVDSDSGNYTSGYVTTNAGITLSNVTLYARHAVANSGNITLTNAGIDCRVSNSSAFNVNEVGSIAARDGSIISSGNSCLYGKTVYASGDIRDTATLDTSNINSNYSLGVFAADYIVSGGNMYTNRIGNLGTDNDETLNFLSRNTALGTTFSLVGHKATGHNVSYNGGGANGASEVTKVSCGGAFINTAYLDAYNVYVAGNMTFEHSLNTMVYCGGNYTFNMGGGNVYSPYTHRVKGNAIITSSVASNTGGISGVYADGYVAAYGFTAGTYNTILGNLYGANVYVAGSNTCSLYVTGSIASSNTGTVFMFNTYCAGKVFMGDHSLTTNKYTTAMTVSSGGYAPNKGYNVFTGASAAKGGLTSCGDLLIGTNCAVGTYMYTNTGDSVRNSYALNNGYVYNSYSGSPAINPSSVGMSTSSVSAWKNLFVKGNLRFGAFLNVEGMTTVMKNCSGAFSYVGGNWLARLWGGLAVNGRLALSSIESYCWYGTITQRIGYYSYGGGSLYNRPSVYVGCNYFALPALFTTDTSNSDGTYTMTGSTSGKTDVWDIDSGNVSTYLRSPQSDNNEWEGVNLAGTDIPYDFVTGGIAYYTDVYVDAVDDGDTSYNKDGNSNRGNTRRSPYGNITENAGAGNVFAYYSGFNTSNYGQGRSDASNAYQNHYIFTGHVVLERSFCGANNIVTTNARGESSLSYDDSGLKKMITPGTSPTAAGGIRGMAVGGDLFLYDGYGLCNLMMRGDAWCLKMSIGTGVAGSFYREKNTMFSSTALSSGRYGVVCCHNRYAKNYTGISGMNIQTNYMEWEDNGGFDDFWKTGEAWGGGKCWSWFQLPKEDDVAYRCDFNFYQLTWGEFAGKWVGYTRWKEKVGGSAENKGDEKSYIGTTIDHAYQRVMTSFTTNSGLTFAGASSANSMTVSYANVVSVPGSIPSEGGTDSAQVATNSGGTFSFHNEVLGTLLNYTVNDSGTTAYPSTYNANAVSTLTAKPTATQITAPATPDVGSTSTEPEGANVARTDTGINPVVKDATVTNWLKVSNKAYAVSNTNTISRTATISFTLTAAMANTAKAALVREVMQSNSYDYAKLSEILYTAQLSRIAVTRKTFEVTEADIEEYNGSAADIQVDTTSITHPYEFRDPYEIYDNAEPGSTEESLNTQVRNILKAPLTKANGGVSYTADDNFVYSMYVNNSGTLDKSLFNINYDTPVETYTLVSTDENGTILTRTVTVTYKVLRIGDGDGDHRRTEDLEAPQSNSSMPGWLKKLVGIIGDVFTGDYMPDRLVFNTHNQDMHVLMPETEQTGTNTYTAYMIEFEGNYTRCAVRGSGRVFFYLQAGSKVLLNGDRRSNSYMDFGEIFYKADDNNDFSHNENWQITDPNAPNYINQETFNYNVNVYRNNYYFSTAGTFDMKPPTCCPSCENDSLTRGYKCENNHFVATDTKPTSCAQCSSTEFSRGYRCDGESRHVFEGGYWNEEDSYCYSQLYMLQRDSASNPNSVPTYFVANSVCIHAVLYMPDRMNSKVILRTDSEFKLNDMLTSEFWGTFWQEVTNGNIFKSLWSKITGSGDEPEYSPYELYQRLRSRTIYGSVVANEIQFDGADRATQRYIFVKQPVYLHDVRYPLDIVLVPLKIPPEAVDDDNASTVWGVSAIN